MAMAMAMAMAMTCNQASGFPKSSVHYPRNGVKNMVVELRIV